MKTGVPPEVLEARYGREPISLITVATIVVELRVAISDVLKR